MNNIDKLFRDMVKNGLVSTSSTWIQRAVSQKHAKMTLALAHSVPLIYDNLQKALSQCEKFN